VSKCCREYQRILNVLNDVMAHIKPTDHDRLVMIRGFIRSEWDAHLERLGEHLPIK
jgi:hypothetical protein